MSRATIPRPTGVAAIMGSTKAMTRITCIPAERYRRGTRWSGRCSEAGTGGVYFSRSICSGEKSSRSFVATGGDTWDRFDIDWAVVVCLLGNRCNGMAVEKKRHLDVFPQSNNSSQRVLWGTRSYYLRLVSITPALRPPACQATQITTCSRHHARGSVALATRTLCCSSATPPPTSCPAPVCRSCCRHCER